MIPIMLTGADVIGQAQTGTGKTAAFALPILNNLEADQGTSRPWYWPLRVNWRCKVADAMTGYGAHSRVRVLAVYGGQPYARRSTSSNAASTWSSARPGACWTAQTGVLDLSKLRTLVLDEATKC